MHDRRWNTTGFFQGLRSQIKRYLEQSALFAVHYDPHHHNYPKHLTPEQVQDLYRDAEITFTTARSFLRDPDFTPTFALYVRMVLWFENGHGGGERALAALDWQDPWTAFKSLGAIVDSHYDGRGGGAAGSRVSGAHKTGRGDVRLQAHVGRSSDSDED